MMRPEICQNPVGSDQIPSIKKSLRESGYLHTSDVAHGMNEPKPAQSF